MQRKRVPIIIIPIVAVIVLQDHWHSVIADRTAYDVRYSYRPLSVIAVDMTLNAVWNL